MADFSRWRLPPRGPCCQVCEDDTRIDLVSCPDCKLIFLCKRHDGPGAFDFHKKTCRLMREKEEDLLNEEHRCSEWFGVGAATISYDDWRATLPGIMSISTIQAHSNHIQAYINARQEYMYSLFAIDTGMALELGLFELLQMYLNGQCDMPYIPACFLTAIFQAVETGPEICHAHLRAMKMSYERIRDNTPYLVQDLSFNFPELSLEQEEHFDPKEIYQGNPGRIIDLERYEVLVAKPELTKYASEFWPDIFDFPVVPDGPIKLEPRVWMLYGWMKQPIACHLQMMQLVLKLKAIADLRAIEAVKHACSRLPMELILQVQWDTTPEYMSGESEVLEAIHEGECLDYLIRRLNQDVVALMKELDQISLINETLYKKTHIFFDFFRFCMSGIAMHRLGDERSSFFYALKNDIAGAADQIWDEWTRTVSERGYPRGLIRRMTYSWDNLTRKKPDTRTLAHLRGKATVGRTRRNSVSTPTASSEGAVSHEAKTKKKLQPPSNILPDGSIRRRCAYRNLKIGSR